MTNSEKAVADRQGRTRHVRMVGSWRELWQKIGGVWILVSVRTVVNPGQPLRPWRRLPL